MPATLQQLPRDAEVPALEAGCEAYGKREVHEVEQQGHPDLPPPRRPTRRAASAAAGRAMAEVDPDQEAALRRLRPAFGLVVIVKVVDHEAGHGDDQVAEDGDQVPSPGR
jgi:hypothetical protein